MRPNQKNLNQFWLKEAINYDAETGIFRWRKDGSIAGTRRKCGYWVIRINGHLYFAHRLAWLYMAGSWPEELVDHRNCDNSDNRWENLRECTYAENARNARPWRKVNDLPKGVHKSKRKFSASITVNGRVIYLGLHINPELAHAAYCAAAAKHHKEFARTS